MRKTSNVTGYISSPRKKSKKNLYLMILFASTFLITAALVYLKYSYNLSWPDWTGLGDYDGPLTKDQRGKTLWDWLELLIIPLFISFIAYRFSKTQQKTQQSIENDRKREEALHSYMDKMTELILEKGLGQTVTENEAINIVRTRTLATLRMLDPARKSLLIRFLNEVGLIKQDSTNDLLTYAPLNQISLVNYSSRLEYLEGARDWVDDRGGIIGRPTVIDDFRNAQFKDAVLELAKFISICLQNASFIRADLNFASLLDCSCDHSDFSYASMIEVDVTQSSFRSANLYSVNLLRSILSFANFSDANMENANLEEVKASFAVFKNSTLTRANLKRASFRAADLTGANLTNANLQKTDLRNSMLTSANLMNSNLQKSDLRDSKLTDANLQCADLRGADLRRADLKGADLSGANLKGAKLYPWYLKDVKSLSGAIMHDGKLHSEKGIYPGDHP